MNDKSGKACLLLGTAAAAAEGFAVWLCCRSSLIVDGRSHSMSCRPHLHQVSNLDSLISGLCSGGGAFGFIILPCIFIEQKADSERPYTQHLQV